METETTIAGAEVAAEVVTPESLVAPPELAEGETLADDVKAEGRKPFDYLTNPDKLDELVERIQSDKQLRAEGKPTSTDKQEDAGPPAAADDKAGDGADKPPEEPKPGDDKVKQAGDGKESDAANTSPKEPEIEGLTEANDTVGDEEAKAGIGAKAARREFNSNAKAFRAAIQHTGSAQALLDAGVAAHNLLFGGDEELEASWKAFRELNPGQFNKALLYVIEANPDIALSRGLNRPVSAEEAQALRSGDALILQVGDAGETTGDDDLDYALSIVDEAERKKVYAAFKQLQEAQTRQTQTAAGQGKGEQPGPGAAKTGQTAEGREALDEVGISISEDVLAQPDVQEYMSGYGQLVSNLCAESGLMGSPDDTPAERYAKSVAFNGLLQTVNMAYGQHPQFTALWKHVEPLIADGNWKQANKMYGAQMTALYAEVLQEVYDGFNGKFSLRGARSVPAELPADAGEKAKAAAQVAAIAGSAPRVEVSDTSRGLAGNQDAKNPYRAGTKESMLWRAKQGGRNVNI